MNRRMSGSEVRRLLAKAKPIRRHVSGEMNRVERRYSEELQLQKLAGMVKDFEFERITFRVGPDLRYTPDFDVIADDNVLEFYEVKPGKINRKTGKHTYYAEGDAIVKLRATADKFPWFRFFLVWPVGAAWHKKEISPGSIEGKP